MISCIPTEVFNFIKRCHDDYWNAGSEFTFNDFVTVKRKDEVATSAGRGIKESRLP